MSDLPAREALAEVARVRRRIRSRRWWYVASGLVMAAFLTTYYVAMAVWPDAGDHVLPAVLAVAGILLLMQWRMRAVPREAARLEEKTVWASLGLALVPIVLNGFLLPEGLSVWVVLSGLPPALPFLYLAWRVGRR